MKNKKLLNSFKYAFKGIFSSFKSERNMKIHVLIMLIVILMGIFFHISIGEWIICLILFCLVISGELFNTAIETTVDLVSLKENYQAGLAKDIAAGAVLVLAFGSALIGLIIFVPKIISLF